jgi:hypothetical protein
LLNGKGKFPKEETKTSQNTTVVSPIQENNAEGDTMQEVKNTASITSNSNELDIERIVVFYKNGTFKNYTP